MKYKLKQNVFVTELADSLALLDVDTGTYFSLNAAGALIWDKISHGASVFETVDALCDEYDVTREIAQRDCEMLIDNLVSQGIVALDDKPIAG